MERQRSSRQKSLRQRSLRWRSLRHRTFRKRFLRRTSYEAVVLDGLVLCGQWYDCLTFPCFAACGVGEPSLFRFLSTALASGVTGANPSLMYVIGACFIHELFSVRGLSVNSSKAW